MLVPIGDEMVDERASAILMGEAVRASRGKLDVGAFLKRPRGQCEGTLSEAVLVACAERPRGFGFLTGDDRLRRAAEAEGFAVS